MEEAKSAHVLKRAQAALRDGVWLTLYEASRDVVVYRPLLMLLWAFDLVQMLTLALASVRRALPLRASRAPAARRAPRALRRTRALTPAPALLQAPTLPWVAQPVMAGGVYRLLLTVGIIPSLPGTAFPADAELATFSALLCALLGLFAWSVAAHAGAVAYKPAWRAALLRGLTFVVLQGLVVPTFASLAAVFDCTDKGTWLPANTTVALPCWQGAHAAAVFGELAGVGARTQRAHPR